MRKIFSIGEHNIVFSRGSSSLDPWSSKYCDKIGLAIVCTSDVVDYALIDGEQIYRIHNPNRLLELLINDLTNDSISSLDELMSLYKDLFGTLVGNLSDMKRWLDEEKKKIDKLKGRPSLISERERIIAKWRKTM